MKKTVRMTRTRRGHRGLTLSSARTIAPVFLLAILHPQDSHAIPAFARRHEISCNTCHQYHYPRLNSYGRRFRENGYQLPTGAEDPARAKRMVEPGTLDENLQVFKELPINLRGQVFGVVPTDKDAQEKPAYENKIFSFLVGGGPVAQDVSFFFSWTPFPDPGIHQARIGLHNIAKDLLGEGSLNVRAGALFLLDFQRPGHRFLAPGPNDAGSVTVGLNRFHLDDPNLGVQFYGRPNWGPLGYEVAIVAGDPGEEGTERDDWKDIFSRLNYIFFQNTDHELSLGGFGYVGRSDIVTDLGSVTLAQRDDFWLAGGDAEFDIGMFNIFAMAYASRHDDPLTNGESVDFSAFRLEGIWGITRNWMTSISYNRVDSSDMPTLDREQMTPHLTYELATNVLATAMYRANLIDADLSSFVVVLDTAF